MEVINLGGLEEIKINLDPPASSNSLPGAELLMNHGKKDTNTIQLSDIDKLEQELNSLSEVKLDPMPSTPTASPITWSIPAPRERFGLMRLTP